MEEEIKEAEIEVTPEQEKRAELEKRSKEFGDELKELSKKHEFDLATEMQYLPQGIMARIILIDTRK